MKQPPPPNGPMPERGADLSAYTIALPKLRAVALDWANACVRHAGPVDPDHLYYACKIAIANSREDATNFHQVLKNIVFKGSVTRLTTGVSGARLASGFLRTLGVRGQAGCAKIPRQPVRIARRKDNQSRQNSQRRSDFASAGQEARYRPFPDRAVCRRAD